MRSGSVRLNFEFWQFLKFNIQLSENVFIMMMMMMEVTGKGRACMPEVLTKA